MITQKSTGIRLASAESLRGIAALMIVFYHLVELAQLPLPNELSIIKTHFGLGVPLFYALSGFVLSFGYADKLAKNPELIQNFLIGRLFRIAPLFFAVTIFWRLLGWLLWSWSTQSQALILNFTFLFGLVPGEHESLIMAGWSIGVEMLFYLIFPTIALLLRNIWITLLFSGFSLILSAAVFNAFSAAGMHSYAYMNLATHLPFFMAGVLTFRVWEKYEHQRGRLGWLALLTASALSTLMLINSDLYQALFNLNFGAMHRNIWAIIFALFIYSTCAINIPMLQNGILFWFGRVSFSMYLLHPILMVAMIKLGVIEWFSQMGSWPGFIVGSIATCASLSAVSFLTHKFIEIPGIEFGRRLSSNARPPKNQHEGPSHSFNSERHEPRQDIPAPSNSRHANFLKFFPLDLGKSMAWNISLYIGVLLALLFIGYFSFATLRQQLVDVHSFRQTQTALTSYWMLKEGWKLAYQTPVAGFPWSIPFEFPIYQTIVSAIVWISGSNLIAAGRFLSFIFLAACAWPIFATSKRLGLPKQAPFICCILLWSAPLYSYWGRTFMIETAAIFFSVACIPFAIDIGRRSGGRKSIALYLAFSTLGILQKSTTTGPVLLILFIALFVEHFHTAPITWRSIRTIALKLTWIVIPVFIGIIWAKYSDVVKLQNPFGAQLTSTALTTWNFGTLNQRLALSTWREIIWNRGFFWNGGAVVGIGVLLLPWFLGAAHRRAAQLSLLSLCLYLAPILIFTNLHIVHEYYQVGCTIFLISAMAISLGSLWNAKNRFSFLAPAAIILIVISNIYSFNNYYKIVSFRSLEESDAGAVQAFKIGKYLATSTPANAALIVFSQSYSSEIGFNAERKSVNMPPWFINYLDVWENPENYVGNMDIGAIVICPVTDKFPTIKDIENKITNTQKWTRQSIYGCEILMPSKG